jgi:hypothetical protein
MHAFLMSALVQQPYGNPRSGVELSLALGSRSKPQRFGGEPVLLRRLNGRTRCPSKAGQSSRSNREIRTESKSNLNPVFGVPPLVEGRSGGKESYGVAVRTVWPLLFVS